MATSDSDRAPGFGPVPRANSFLQKRSFVVEPALLLGAVDAADAGVQQLCQEGLRKWMTMGSLQFGSLLKWKQKGDAWKRWATRLDGAGRQGGRDRLQLRHAKGLNYRDLLLSIAKFHHGQPPFCQTIGVTA